MIRWRAGSVVSVLGSWPGAVELLVDVPSDGEVHALAYVDLVGTPGPGDRVLLNTTALQLGLGTGGYSLVVALPDRLPADPTGPGHLVKARYTPLQPVVLGVDDPQSPHHETIAASTSVDRMPVVVADLHSALPAIVAGALADQPAVRIAYVQTDGAALPVSFSRTVAALRPQLVGVLSAGQCFGGDLEAVTVHTALLAARHVLGADISIVIQGPGNLGTGTPWGFSGVAAGEAINAVAALGGRPVAALRISDADPRDRHRGLSHHSLTAYGKVALAAADVVVPLGLPEDLAARVDAEVAVLGERHRLVRVRTDGLDAVLRASPAPLSTMGRGLDQDHAYFLGCAAAGRHAAELLHRPAGTEHGRG